MDHRGRAARGPLARRCRLRRRRRRHWRRERQRQDRRRAGSGPEARRQADRAVDGRRRLHRLRPDLLPDGSVHLLVDAEVAVLVQARRPDQPAAGPRRGPAGSVRGRQDRHDQDQAGRQVLAAVRGSGHVGRRQVRDRARLLQLGGERLHGVLLRRPRGRQGRRGRGHQDLGHHDARRLHGRAEVQASRRRRHGRGCARVSGHGSRAREVRQEVRRRAADDATARTSWRRART